MDIGRDTLPLSVIGCWTGGPHVGSLVSFQQPWVMYGSRCGDHCIRGYFAIPLSSDWDGGVLWEYGEILEFQDDKGSVYWGWIRWKEYSLISSRNGLLRYAMRDLYES